MGIDGFTDFIFTGGTPNSAVLTITAQIEDSSNNVDPNNSPAQFSQDLALVGEAGAINWSQSTQVSLTSGTHYNLDMNSKLVVTTGNSGITVSMDPKTSSYQVTFVPEPPSFVLAGLGVLGIGGFAAISRRRLRLPQTAGTAPA
jgi:hypothetical protein